MSSAATPLLRMAGISKSYPGVRALDGVDLEVAAGEVHVWRVSDAGQRVAYTHRM